MKTNCRNFRYYFEFETGVWKYRLYYVPADVADITQTRELRMPKGCFSLDLNSDGGLPDEMPTGLTESYILNFKVNLKRFKFNILTGVGDDWVDWTDVRQTIIDGCYTDGNGTPIKRSEYFNGTIDGVNFTLPYAFQTIIPNRWYLVSNGGAGSNYNVLEFHGIQDVKPEKKFDIDGEIWELTLTDIHSASMKHVVNKEFWVGGDLTKHVPFLYDYYIQDFDYYHFDRAIKSAGVGEIEILKIVHFIEFLDKFRAFYFRQFLRRPLTLITKDYGAIYSHIKMFEILINPNGTNEPSNQLTPSDLYMVAYTLDNNVRIGGNCDVSDNESLINEYETFKDLMTAWIDGVNTKAIIKFDIGEISHTPTDVDYLKIYKVLEPTSATVDLTAREIGRENFDLKSGLKIPAKLNANIKTADADRKTFELKDIGLMSEQNDEIQPIFHNCASLSNYIGIDSLKEFPSTEPYSYVTQIRESLRKIYYINVNGRGFKICDDVEINLGSHDGIETNIVTRDNTKYTTNRFPPVTFKGDDGIDRICNLTVDGLRIWIFDYTNKINSLPAVLVRSRKYLLANRNTAFITCSISHDLISLANIGNTYNIDLNAITGLNYLSPPYSVKAILTRVKVKYYENKCDCVFWLRGF